MSIIIWAGQFLAAAGDFAHIGALLGGTLGSIYFMGLLIKRSDLSIKDIFNYENGGMNIKTALFPYIILIGSVLLFQIPFISNYLPDIELAFSFPGFTTGLGYAVEAEEAFSPIALFGHPIFFLIISSLSGGILFYIKGHLKPEGVKKNL